MSFYSRLLLTVKFMMFLDLLVEHHLLAFIAFCTSLFYKYYTQCVSVGICLQCFHTVGWLAAGKASSL